MRYLAEVRTEWRALLAATMGLGAGFSVTMYSSNIFVSALIKDFGWSKSQFAMVATIGVMAVFGVAIAGRLADIIGVRRTALIGVCALPISYFAFGQMTGDIRQYLVIFFFQAALCMTTSAAVYNRTIVERFQTSRGLALAIGASGPALVGMIGSPLLNMLVEAHGWRAGYHAMMIFSVVFGGLALWLLPPSRADAPKPALERPRRTRDDYALFLGRPAFWMIFVAMFLCSLPHPVMIFQLKMVLIERGIAPYDTGLMLSAWASGVLVGRFASGLALDRMPAHIVAAVANVGLGAGLFIVATTYDVPAVLSVGAFLMGLAFGADGDVIAYLVAQHFGVRLFGSVGGLIIASTSLATAAGGVLLSITLRETQSYTTYLLLCSVSALAGAAMLLPLGRMRPVASEAPA